MKTKILILLSILFFSLHIFSQENLGPQTITQFDIENSVLRPDAPTLTESIPMEIGIDNQLFLSGVGGVSFDQVALPESGFSINSVQLNYNKNAQNGSRLELTVNNHPASVYLPDWLLIPLAKYSESPWYSCVTIFGKLNNKTLEKLIVDHKGRVINYHPSFDNTLLGIRLLYMDMLVGYEFTHELPKNSIGEYILGLGEVEPNHAENHNGAYYLSQHFNEIQNKYNQTFRSYIISDYSQKIHFNVVNDSLIIDGFPYFYCWRFNYDIKGYNINDVAESIATKYNKQISELSGQTPEDWMIDKLIALSKKYDGKYGFYTSGTFIDLVKLQSDTEKRQFLEKYYPESLFQMIVETEAYMDSESIIYLKEYSDDVSAKPELFEAANPEVWNATVYTMRFGAFFRYIKSNYPLEWSAFIDQIQSVDAQPRVKTPTAMYNTGDTEVENAILLSSPLIPTGKGVLKYYPNPFTDFIILNNTKEMEKVSIYGTDGRLYFQEFNCPTNYRLNTSALKAGVYSLVVIEKGMNLRTFSIVKK
jgi:hypothetical protein